MLYRGVHTPIPGPELVWMQVRNRAQTLLDAIWLQLADALSVNAEIHRCLQCEMWFPAGRGFGRRQDAKFCSAEHQILFNNQKRKEIV
jgi:hypothetical protein